MILFGKNSDAAYSQLVAAEHPQPLGHPVLSPCEKPYETRPLTPGGFGLHKATAASSVTYRALYQALRLPRTWRWRNTYGRLAEYSIDRRSIDSCVRPVLKSSQIWIDGRKPSGRCRPDTPVRPRAGWPTVSANRPT